MGCFICLLVGVKKNFTPEKHQQFFLSSQTVIVCFENLTCAKSVLQLGADAFFQLKFFFWMKIFDSDTKWSNDKWSHVQNFNQKFYQYHLYHYKNAFKYQNTKIKRYCWHSTWNAQFFSTTFSFLLKMHFLFTEYKRQRKKCLEWKRKKCLIIIK